MREASSDEKNIVMVGKGIVYDTGGLSIKDRFQMPGMKTDMGGAAAMLQAFDVAVRNGLPENTNLFAILCLAENAVGPLATRPDDIHTLYSGLTVEVNDTDCEGRLILADGVAFAAAHLAPSCIIDMATLTGAQGIACGYRHAAIVSNDEWVEQVAIKAGRASGDLVHPLPYCPEFFTPEFKSAVANMKNRPIDRFNGSCCAAGQFIANNMEEYIAAGKPWLHIDMAFPATFKVDGNSRATGYGVALLTDILGKF